jgi:capsid protein
MIRMAEARRLCDGDFFFLKIAGNSAARGALQAIEGDRVAVPSGGTPKGFKSDHWTNGVKTSAAGVAREYCICKRTDYGGLDFERIVPATNVYQLGCFDRFDQIRGVSPLAAAINTLTDTYEGFSYALAKLKVSQLFGLVFYRDATDGFDNTSATVDSDDDGIADSGYEVDFGSGPVQLDLNPGDRAEFLEAKTPATETMDYLKLMVHVALKSLDIPYSFFDESHTNFFGSRGALLNYLKSCESKIADLQDMLSDITEWRLRMAVADGDLTLPPGMSVSDLSSQKNWQWVPGGVEWWDPSKEVKGHTMAIAAGLDNPQRVCRQAGTDFYSNVDAIAEAMKYARSKGVSLQMAVPGMASIDKNDTSEVEAQ